MLPDDGNRTSSHHEKLESGASSSNALVDLNADIIDFRFDVISRLHHIVPVILSLSKQNRQSVTGITT